MERRRSRSDRSEQLRAGRFAATFTAGNARDEHVHGAELDRIAQWFQIAQRYETDLRLPIRFEREFNGHTRFAANLTVSRRSLAASSVHKRIIQSELT